MSEWQKIPDDVDPKMAPFDGARVLLAVTDDDPPGYGYVCEGYYDTDCPSEGGWFKANMHWTDAADGSVLPTYWQPLPKPPRR